MEEVDSEEKAWAPAGSAIVQNVAIRRRTPPDSPVIRGNVPSAGRRWIEDDESQAILQDAGVASDGRPARVPL